MADVVMLIPMVLAASIVIGPCTSHWPPPEGTNMLMMPAAQNWSM